MRVAYAIQNVGINLDEDVGDAVPVKYTLRGLQQAGHTVHCFYLSGRNVIRFDNIQILTNSNYCTQGVAGTRFFRFVESIIRRFQGTLRLPYFAFIDSYRFYKACIRYLPEYDLCHEHQGNLSIGAALACARLGLPYVLTVSSPPFLEQRLFGKSYRGIQAWISRLEAKFAYRIARKIIVVSRSSEQQLIEEWSVDPEKIVIMPNGVDVELFGQKLDPKPIRAKYGVGSSPVIGFVGNFQKWHGIDILLKSFAQILNQISDARMLLVGGGPARPEIEKWIFDLGLVSKVTITGRIPQNDVPRLLSAIDVTVLPYPRFQKELWFSPLKMYEYMAAGKAIVASNYGQIADVLQNGFTGILVEPGNVNELTQAMIQLLNDKELRMQLGNNAYNQAKNHHSWGQYIARLEKIYISMI